jgi:uncharacterized membrane protein
VLRLSAHASLEIVWQWLLSRHMADRPPLYGICPRPHFTAIEVFSDQVELKRAITAEAMPSMMKGARTCVSIRAVMRAVLAAFYLAAGIVHLVAPDAFLPIVPDFVPLPRETVLATGVCEIAGSVALMTQRWRRLAGVMLALYAVCVFPANIKHALAGVHVPPLPDSWWYHGPRLALQPVLVWWALFCAGVIDWPAAPRPK